MRLAQDKVPNIIVSNKDSSEISTSAKSKSPGTNNPLHSLSSTPLSVRRKVTQCTQGSDLLMPSPSSSMIEADLGLQPESVSITSNSVKVMQKTCYLDASVLETTPGIPILDQLAGVTTVPFKDESTKAVNPCSEDENNNESESHEETRKYSVQQVSYGPIEGDAGYVSRKACYLGLEKMTTGNESANSIEQILVESAIEQKGATVIESYFTKQITPPIYKTHRPTDRKIKSLTPQLILDRDGMAVETSKQGVHSIRIPEKQILIRTSPPFKRLIQTSYGDFITKFECPSFNVTRYNTLSRLRWMSYQISHSDNNLNPNQKMQPAISNIFCFQTEIYQVVKEKLSSSKSDTSKRFIFSIDELKSILHEFESYYKEFESLPKPIVISQEYAQIHESSSVEKYGGSKAPVFDQTMFQDDKFRYHIDLLGDQFGFNIIRCPAPIEELLHNEDLAIADADTTTESIERSRTTRSIERIGEHKRDRQMIALIKENQKIDLFNPKLITSSDTYTIMDTECKVEASHKAGYLRLDSFIAGSPLPEGSISISQLMQHGLSVVEAERSITTSIYKPGSTVSSMHAP
ncbi:Hypothetical protein GLP15_1493 [Giardia lamblia P15]|uniref:Uncharacterized protein n=1 Tax=Giardia intestinalis (strain P15) TaxID=658858 RepID=E1EYP7_GIAIA|nr:Hypothetical protein GLP15_1493 [Giardia lamblia P15]